MSKPLAVKADAQKKAADWHRAVFTAYGPHCFLHRLRDPKSKTRATDAAHVIKRSRLGTKLAYVSPRLGRPLCRECHQQQELGLDSTYEFPLDVRIDATRAHNEHAKVPFEVPQE